MPMYAYLLFGLYFTLLNNFITIHSYYIVLPLCHFLLDSVIHWIYYFSLTDISSILYWSLRVSYNFLLYWKKLIFLTDLLFYLIILSSLNSCILSGCSYYLIEFNFYFLLTLLSKGHTSSDIYLIFCYIICN